MRRLLCVLSLAAVLGVVGACAAETSADLLDQAKAALKQKDTAEASALLEKIISTYPSTLQAAEASWMLGFIADAGKDFPRAEALFKWVVERHPSSPKAADALLRVAYLTKKLGRKDDAERFLAVTVRYPDTPEAALAKYRIGRIYTRTRDFDEAIAFFRAAKDSPRGSVEVRAEAAALEGITLLQKWYKTGDLTVLETAITSLEDVEKQFPKETKGVAWSRFRLGTYYLHSGLNLKDKRYGNDPARAREILQQAIRTLPDNYFTWWMKEEVACSYIREGKYEEAVKECRAVLSQNPPASWADYLLYLMGDCQVRLGQKAEAVASFEELIERFPKTDWADAARGRLKNMGV